MEVSFSPLKVFFPTRSSSSSSFIIKSSISFKNQSKQTPQTFTPSLPKPSSLNSDPQDKSSSSIHRTNLFHLTFLSATLSSAVSSFAADTVLLPAEPSNKINLEAIVVSIDNFFNRYPFFVAGVTFIWLVAIPLTEEYLQKYKFISAINAFKKLKNDPTTQLLDIRDNKSLLYMGSPNLKLLNKNAFQVEFIEEDEDGFVKKVIEKFPEPANTVVCILDNFDGNSIKVAELLVKSGFKETYAIRGGIRGKNGWQEIQENLLPPSVHIYPKKKKKKLKVKNQQQLDTNGGVNQSDINGQATPFSTSSDSGRHDEKPNNNVGSGGGGGYVMKSSTRPSSPYPNYPDWKPPSSPTPSKPGS